MKLDKLEKIFRDLGIETSYFEPNLSLPLAYQTKFTIMEARINDKIPYLFIKEERRSTLESFISQAEFISKKSGKAYLLVFSNISKADQRLLLKARIPFMDYSGNLFLPELGLILKKKIEVIKEKKFTPSEQLVFTYMLDTSNMEIDVADIQKKSGLSIPSIYRVLRKFVTLGWLSSNYGGYHFEKRKQELFHDGQKFFFNPVKKSLYIEPQDLEYLREEDHKRFIYSGYFALSIRSMIDETKKTYAVSSKYFYQLIKQFPINYYEKRIPGLIELQLWYYAPIKSKDTVDPLSLYLSLRDDDDPRIKKEVATLLRLELGEDV